MKVIVAEINDLVELENFNLDQLKDMIWQALNNSPNPVKIILDNNIDWDLSRHGE